MLYKGKNWRLPDGQEAVLRSGEGRDGIAMLTLWKQVCTETEFLIRYPSEITVTPEEEARILEEALRSPEKYFLMCYVEGKAAGSCQLNRGERLKTRHRGTVGLSLLQEYWGLGLATVMLEEMAVLGRKWGLMQLELSYMEGNDRARRLYERMGYAPVGEMPRAFQLLDGSLKKEIYMRLPL